MGSLKAIFFILELFIHDHQIVGHDYTSIICIPRE